MYRLLPAETEILAGLETGGIPVATLLSHLSLSHASPIPAIFVRKKAKEYGTAKLAEGIDFSGRRTVVIEDVVTTGGQIIESAAELKKRGAIIDTVLCVIQREPGASSRLADAGLTLVPLFRLENDRLV